MISTLSLPNDDPFSGEVKVASRIIDYLSSGLYHTPAACLKELINNSYDAGATCVNVFVKPDADRIIVEDNGSGMNKEEFIAHFDRISESHKRDKEDKTDNGRSKIGKIGIGFIAANELCEVMEIFSTKAGETSLLHVSIDFQKMRMSPEERRREDDDFAKADYSGEVLQTDAGLHYTQIFLTAVRGEAKQIMAGAYSQNLRDHARSLYGLGPSSVMEQLKDRNLNTWKDFDAYSETLLQVGLNVPVRYHEGWMPQKLHDRVREFEADVALLDFHVFYDGSELFKPIVFSPPDESILASVFQFKGEHVSAFGYFYAEHGTIKPRDLQGLLVRIRQAAVSEYDHSFWGFSQSDNPLIQRWVSAEIWADDRLEEAMNIDRRTLRIAHPAYVELRKAIHKHLGTVLYQARTKIYEAGNAERKQEKAQRTRTEIETVAREIIAPFAPTAAHNLEQIVQRIPVAPSQRKAFEKKYTLAEVYQTIIEIGEGILTQEQMEKLLLNLTERLGK